MRLRPKNKTIYITVASLIIGLILSLQWQAQTSATPITREASRERVNLSMQRLEEEQTQLKQQIADLRTELANLQSSMGDRRQAIGDANSELERQKIAAGFVELQGAGVVVKLNDSSETSVPDGEDPEKYLIHEFDLRDVTNTLWSAGAEAVSINQERFIGTSAIYCVGSTIMVNDARMSPPYEIHAIGDPQKLEAALQSAPGLASLRARAQDYQLGLEIQRADKVNVPAFSGSYEVKYAHAK